MAKSPTQLTDWDRYPEVLPNVTRNPVKFTVTRFEEIDHTRCRQIRAFYRIAGARRSISATPTRRQGELETSPTVCLVSAQMEPIPSLAQIEAARAEIRGSALRTPLVRLNLSEAPAEIYLKLENLQPIGSFKIRGAANAIARALRIPCTMIAPNTAPETKI